jgi:MFS superfamily sulfate permease-like transporter
MFGLSSKRIQKFKIMRFFPVPLLVVFTSVLLNLFAKWNFPSYKITLDHMVILPKITSLDKLIENLHFPDWSVLMHQNVWLLAFTIAAVASIETLLNLDAVDKLDPERTISPPNKELFAQGVGNMVCGLIGGIPITSVIVRSSANVNAGAHSKVSAVVHGLLLLGCVLLIPNVLSMIPLASLAAILLYTGYKLTHLGIIKSIYKAGMSQFLPFAATVFVMLTTDILKGIAAGMIVSVFYILKFNLKTPYKIATTMIHGRSHTLITLSEDVTFLNKARFHEELFNIIPNSILIIDARNNKTIDLDVVEMVDDFAKKSASKNIELELINFTART